ncbi:hypothetical protein EDC01DRAFT_525298 [Geopyxis carbonaria]|nr:hypothetical protein EDC01DRAFT_525298 [Geopyxis carbonaria]
MRPHQCMRTERHRIHMQQLNKYLSSNKPSTPACACSSCIQQKPQNLVASHLEFSPSKASLQVRSTPYQNLSSYVIPSFPSVCHCHFQSTVHSLACADLDLLLGLTRHSIISCGNFDQRFPFSRFHLISCCASNAGKALMHNNIRQLCEGYLIPVIARKLFITTSQYSAIHPVHPLSCLRPPRNIENPTNPGNICDGVGKA